MNTFELILSPFIFIIEQLLLLGYELTGSYGIAIVLLSLSISLLLLPVFMLIERAKRRDDAVKRRMKPVLDEIKRCYKGQERYYYIRTLHRQHGYNSLKALVPVLSLLLQIPFFIAAYQFLLDYEPLVGESFLFIKDLSAPDGVFGSINLLPIVMTLVNIATAYLYTRNGDTAERKQMLVIAGVFLVLLFNLPSGLVLYWTMNNVFSFLRLFVTNPEVFKGSAPAFKWVQRLSLQNASNSVYTNLFNAGDINRFKTKTKAVFAPFSIILVLLAVASQVSWMYRRNFDEVWVRIPSAIAASLVVAITIPVIIYVVIQLYKVISGIRVKPSIFFTLLFLSIYFYTSAKYYFTGVSNTLLLFALISLLVTQIIGLLYFIRSQDRTNQLLFHLSSFVVLLLVVIQFMNLLVAVNGDAILINVLNVQFSVDNSTWLDVARVGIAFSVVSVPFCLHNNSIKLPVIPSYRWFIYSLAIFYILGLIFLWNPLLAFSSSPETFEFAGINIIKNNYKLFLYGILSLIIVFAILPRRVKDVWILVMLLITAISFIYSTLMPIDLGSLQVTAFSEEQNLAAPISHYVFEALLLIVVFYSIIWLLLKKYHRQIVGGLIALNILLVSYSLYSAVSTGVFFEVESFRTEQTSEDKLDGEQVPLEVMKPIRFSKTEPNIIYFLIDGFQGWFVEQILEENPTLRDELEGFVWYPNTLSMSNYTHSALPSMFSGYDYAVDRMNEELELTIREKMRKASREFILRVKEMGFHYASENKFYKNFDDHIVDSEIPYWDDNWEAYQEYLPLRNSGEIWHQRLYENAILYSVPLNIKPVIYNNREWLGLNKNKKTSSHWTFKWYNFLRLLPYISNSESEEPSFIYIHNAAAHNPWNIVSDNGEYVNDVIPFVNNEWVFKQMVKWIRWMKDNDVYDNTKIIFVSDHGATWSLYSGGLNFESPLIKDKNAPHKISARDFWRLNALLLVKDFNTRADFCIDWRLMSNADVPAIVFDENNPMKGNDPNRTLPTFWTFWASNMIENKTMEVPKHFEVTGSMFDLHNWKRINE